MKTFQRDQIIKLLLTTILIIGFTGWGSMDSNAANNPKKVKFSLWHSFVGADQRAKFMDEILAQFKDKYPEIEIVEQEIPRDQYQTKLKTQAAAGQLPEAFLIWPNAMTREFANANLISDINDLLKSNPDWKNGFVSRALDEFTVNGKIYSAGLGVSVTSIVFYNKALFDKYGLLFPKTFEELKNVVNVFKNNGIIPITVGNKPKWPVQSSIFSLMANRETGSEWLDKVLAKQGAKFTDAEFIKALTRLKELTDLGAFNKDYNSLDDVQMRDYFYKEQAAMVITGSWILPDMIDRMPEEVKKKIELTVLPAFEGGKGNQIAISGVSSTGIVISAKATRKQKEAIKKLIMFLTDENAQRLYTIYNIPVSSKNVNIDPSKVDPLYAKMVDLIKKHPMVTVYDSALNSELTEIVNNGLQAVMIGQLKPEELAKQLQSAVDK